MDGSNLKASYPIVPILRKMDVQHLLLVWRDSVKLVGTGVLDTVKRFVFVLTL